MPIISNSTIGSSSVVNPTTKGDLVTFSNAVVNLGIAPSVNGKVLTQKTDEATGLIWKLPVASKGGLLTSDGTNPDEIPVGSDKKVLTAKASASNGFGIEWDTPKADLFLTSKGDLLTSTGTNINKKSLGNKNQILTADPDSALGFNWEDQKSNWLLSPARVNVFDFATNPITQRLPFFNQHESLAFYNTDSRTEVLFPKKGAFTNFQMVVEDITRGSTAVWRFFISIAGVSSQISDSFTGTGSLTNTSEISVNAGDKVFLTLVVISGTAVTNDEVNLSQFTFEFKETL